MNAGGNSRVSAKRGRGTRGTHQAVEIPGPPAQTEVAKPGQYTAFSHRGARLSNAMKSSKGSDQCVDLQRVIDALTKAFHSPEPDLTDYKAVLQPDKKHRTFIRLRNGATRIGGTDFQY